MAALLTNLEPPGFSASAVLQALQELLAEERLCTMATVCDDAAPYINNVFYAPLDDLRLTVWTSPSSQHGRNLQSRPESAVAIANSATAWGDDIRGVQLFGRMELLKGYAAIRAFQAYAKRFAKLLNWAKAYEDIDRAFQSRFYLLNVDHFKLIDEAKFGKEVYITARVER
jgi:uncharacterized protein